MIPSLKRQKCSNQIQSIRQKCKDENFNFSFWRGSWQILHLSGIYHQGLSDICRVMNCQFSKNSCKPWLELWAVVLWSWNWFGLPSWCGLKITLVYDYLAKMNSSLYYDVINVFLSNSINMHFLFAKCHIWSFLNWLTTSRNS